MNSICMDIKSSSRIITPNIQTSFEKDSKSSDSSKKEIIIEKPLPLPLPLPLPYCGSLGNNVSTLFTVATVLFSSLSV
jgi:hypothetical protein